MELSFVKLSYVLVTIAEQLLTKSLKSWLSVVSFFYEFQVKIPLSVGAYILSIKSEAQTVYLSILIKIANGSLIGLLLYMQFIWFIEIEIECLLVFDSNNFSGCILTKNIIVISIV